MTGAASRSDAQRERVAGVEDSSPELGRRGRGTGVPFSTLTPSKYVPLVDLSTTWTAPHESTSTAAW